MIGNTENRTDGMKSIVAPLNHLSLLFTIVPCMTEHHYLRQLTWILDVSIGAFKGCISVGYEGKKDV